MKNKKMIIGLSISLVISALVYFVCIQYSNNNNELGNVNEETLLDNKSGSVQDGELDLGNAEVVRAGLQEQTDESMVNIRINTSPALQSDGKVNWMIQNSKNNNYIMQVTYKEENGDIIYVSPALQPNQSIQSDFPDMNIEEITGGRIRASVKFYHIETETLAGETGVFVNLSI